MKQGSFVPGSAAAAGRMVVARFRSGEMLKGTTQDFAPNKTCFHVYKDGDEGSQAVKIQVGDLKALFYVKTFEGDRRHSDEFDFDKVVGHGRKAEVQFDDGEMVSGFTMGYHADRPGFFLVPADPESNNARIYILNAAVQSLRWV